MRLCQSSDVNELGSICYDAAYFRTLPIVTDEERQKLFLVIVTNWKKGHRCRAALTDRQSRWRTGGAAGDSARFQICVMHSKILSGRKIRSSYSFHPSFLKRKKLFLQPSLPLIVSLGMPDLSFTGRGKKARPSPGSFFKELPSKVPYKQYRERREERWNGRAYCPHSLSHLGVF